MAEGVRATARLRWLALVVVLLVALVIGSGVLSSSPPTPAQRITSIEAQVKCPSCEDLSVAQSTSPSSLAIRHQIATQVAEGRSDAEIIASLQARYGATVELTPTGGLSVILWLVPLVVILAALGAVVAWRRGRRKESA